MMTGKNVLKCIGYVIACIILTTTIILPSVANAVPAFPTAEGFGANTIGGRGGIIVEVTNLNDSGGGSLRQALEGYSVPRIVVFRVGGTIELSDTIRIQESNSFVTIAGQTAPGGIQLKNYGLQIRDGAHDIIIRHMRFRTGIDGVTAANGGNLDSLLLYGVDNTGADKRVYNVIIDHCSVEWATDENFNIARWVTDVTVQWSIFAEGIKQGKPGVPNHSMGSLTGGRDQTLSIHHSLYAHNSDRNPRSDGSALFDFRNNIIYNWVNDNGAKFASTFRPSNANFVNNFYIKGQNSSLTRDNIGWVGNSTSSPHPTKVYVDGNIGPNCLTPCSNPWDIGFRDANISGGPSADPAIYRSLTEFTDPSNTVITHNAIDLQNLILPTVGSNLPRDSIDTRIIQELTDRTGAIGKGNGTLSQEQDPSLYPILGGGTTPTDSDNDGMPDSWESAHGLDQNDGSDGPEVSSNGYTNVENYLNELAGDFVLPNTPPDPPTGVTATTTGQTITVTWEANTESDLASYNVYMGTSPGNYGAANPVGNTLTYQTAGLSANTTYYFTVTAVNTNDNESLPSNEANATTGSTSGSFPPPMASPVPGSTLTSTTVTFVGGTTPQDIAHSLWVGTTLGTKDLHFGPMTGNTQEVSGLPTSGTIYVRYWTTDDPNTSNGTAWVFTEHTYTMNVAPITHPLTVSLAGSGTGTVTSAPTGITCGSTCTATYDEGTTVTLVASTTSGSTFTSWSGGGCSGSGACVVTLTQAETVTATFTAAPVFPPSMNTPAPGATLTSTTVTFVGGTTPQDIAHSLWVGTTLGTKDLHFGPMTGNTQVVSGLPTSGTIYVRYWTTDDPNTSNGAAWVFTEHTYTMNVAPITHPLTVSLAGSGTGTVTSAPTGITCGSTCTATYDDGTSITLTATPSGSDTFASWSGGGCGGSGACVMTLTQAETVTATFTAAPVFPPLMNTPAPGATLTSTTVTFVGGTTPQDVAHSLWVGTTPGSNNLHAGPMTGNTQVVSGLPTSGTIYVRYWTTDDPNTSNGAAWVFTEHTYTMNVP